MSTRWFPEGFFQAFGALLATAARTLPEADAHVLAVIASMRELAAVARRCTPTEEQLGDVAAHDEVPSQAALALVDGVLRALVVTAEGASNRGPIGEVLASVANGSPDRTPAFEACLGEMVAAISELADRLEDVTDHAACKAARHTQLFFAKDDPRVARASADVLAKYANTFRKLAE